MASGIRLAARAKDSRVSEASGRPQRGRRVRASSLRALLAARALRAFGDGFVSLLLPVYLLALGLSPFEVGVIATATLLGSGALTLVVGLYAGRYRFRTLLLAAATLMAATGATMAFVTGFWPLLLIAVVGTLNPSSGDVERLPAARARTRRAARAGCAAHRVVRALQPLRRAACRSRRALRRRTATDRTVRRRIDADCAAGDVRALCAARCSLRARIPALARRCRIPA